MADSKRSFSEAEMMQIQRGLIALEAAREQLKVGRPVEQIDLDLFDNGLSRLIFNLGEE